MIFIVAVTVRVVFCLIFMGCINTRSVSTLL